MTTQAWSSIAPAFMYSFEYRGNTSKGINFLRGLPITSNTENDRENVVGHGDELGYMFDCNDIFGNPLPETNLRHADDLKVRNNIIGMITKFAKSFNRQSKIGNFTDKLFKSITGKGLPFIKLNTNLEAANDFRFCELSVLGAPLSPLTATSCEGLKKVLSQLTDRLKNLGNTNITNVLYRPPTRSRISDLLKKTLTSNSDNVGYNIFS